MKTIKELRGNPLFLHKQTSSLGQLEYIHTKIIDMDVYLPSRKMNLQRGNVWELWQKQEIILSILMRRFIPKICVMAQANSMGVDTYQIIDGKQRLTAMMEFIGNKFPLGDKFENRYFYQLPDDYQLAIEGFVVSADIIYNEDGEPIPDSMKIEWFNLINFNQTPQDVEHLKALST